ncbi:hypothetical protein EON63_08975 [archaeon]|nr:MAG: hypothetical protein EON63_08975 [archaeon]
MGTHMTHIHTQTQYNHLHASCRWQLQNGGVAFVQTPETQRAKQLMELYMQVCHCVLLSKPIPRPITIFIYLHTYSCIYTYP